VLVGALVGEVNSWEGDLRTGDIIVAVNKAPIYDFKSLIDFTNSLESGHICAVHIEREGQFRYVTLEIN
jgi:type II secretory pathway component PulC